jgi:hypothetical protein
VTHATIEFGGDTIPSTAFGEHLEDTLDHNTGAFEGQLPMTDFWVSDDVLAQSFAFACSHSVLRTSPALPSLAHIYGLNNSAKRKSYLLGFRFASSGLLLSILPLSLALFTVDEGEGTGSI